MKRIRTAIVGTGFIGPAHLEALTRIGGVEVAALASLERDKAGALASRFGIPRVVDDWREVIGDPSIEVVHNCTPNHLHFEINKAAIAAKKHILSEKPLTMTSRESAILVRSARSAGIVNAVNYNYRFYPIIRHAREMVASGEVGKPYLVHGHYLQDWLLYDTDYNWRLESKLSGASRAVADIGSHWCDLVQFVTGRRIVRVFAELVTIHARRKKPSGAAETFKGKEAKPKASASVAVDTEDVGILILEFEGGLRGTCTISQVSAGRKNREWFELDGSRCSVAWDQETPEQLWIGRRDGPNQVLLKDPSLLSDPARPYAHYPGGHPEGYPDGLKNFFRDFYDFIRSGRDPRKTPPSFPTFADGHLENRIVEAVLKSAASRRWVNV